MATPTADSYIVASGTTLVRGGRGGATNALVAIWGQSNAMGDAFRADITASPLSSDSGLATYNSAPFDRVWVWTGSAFDRLNMAANPQGTSGGRFGPEFGLGVRWMRETTSGDLYLVKNAQGSQSITAFAPGAGAMYLAGQPKHAAAEAWLVTNSKAIGARGMVWIQGEADAGQAGGWYSTRLATLVAAWRSDSIIGGSDSVMLWQMHPSSAQYGAGVAADKAAFAAANGPSVTAPVLPYYMKPDNLHLNGRGQVQTGYDCAERILSLPAATV